MGADLDAKVLKAAAFPGTGTWTAVVHAPADLDRLALDDLLADRRIHLGRTTWAALESLRTDGAWGGADLDRASAGDQGEGRNGHGQAGIHGVAI